MIDIFIIGLIAAAVFIPRVIYLYRTRKDDSTTQNKWKSGRYNQRTNATTSFAAIINEARAYRETQKRDYKNREFGENLTLLLLVIAAAIGYLQWRTLNQTDETLRTQQRAWVAPLPAAPIIFVSPPEKDKPISIKVQIQNIGRGPAFNSAHKIELIRFKPAIEGGKFIGGFGSNNTCDGLAPIKGAHTIFPSSISLEQMPALYDTWTNPNYDNAIQNMTELFGIIGCIKYDTIIENRTTRFCFYALDPFPEKKTPLASWVWYFCESGNYAD